jgi:hypothetical protein
MKPYDGCLKNLESIRKRSAAQIFDHWTDAENVEDGNHKSESGIFQIANSGTTFGGVVGRRVVHISVEESRLRPLGMALSTFEIHSNRKDPRDSFHLC